MCVCNYKTLFWLWKNATYNQQKFNSRKVQSGNKGEKHFLNSKTFYLSLFRTQHLYQWKKKSNVVTKLLEKIYLIAGSFCDFSFLFWNFSRVIVHNTKSLWFCYMLWNQLNNFQNSIPRHLIFKIPEWEKPVKTKRKQSVGFCFY